MERGFRFVVRWNNAFRKNAVYDGQPRLFGALANEVRARTRRQSKPLVCVMDGQRSFRKLLQRFEQVTPILDIYHGIERLWNAAHCFHVVKDRMEQSGMRWEAEGAQAVLNLRAIQINGDWNDFIQHRIQTEQAALYGLAG